MIKEESMAPFGFCSDALKEILFEAQPTERGLVQITKVKDRKSPTEHLETAVLLCPEYVEYLKKALKSYLQT